MKRETQPATSAAGVRARQMVDEADFDRVRQLLVESYPVTPLGWNWDVRRWEGRRFYDADPDPARWFQEWGPKVRLWEAGDGRLAAAIFPEGPGDAHPQLLPGHRDLEDEMIAWAEEHLAAPPGDAAGAMLQLFAYDYDDRRQELLRGRGYTQLESRGVARRLRVRSQAPDAPDLAPGYTVRTTDPDDPADCQAIADLLNAAFNRTSHNGAEYRMFTRLAPSFRPELDLVAVAPDGSFGAYVGIPYDEANGRGIFEPVCTHPQHRRLGLALALMQEGLHRLRALGAQDATVETGDMIPANRLYAAMGFTEVVWGSVWEKRGL